MTRGLVPITDVGSQYGGDLARAGTLWFVAAGDRLLVGAFDPVRAMGALSLGMALFLFDVRLLTIDHTRAGRASAGTSG